MAVFGPFGGAGPLEIDANASGCEALAAGAAAVRRYPPPMRKAESTVATKRSLRDRVKDAFTTYGPAVAQFAQLGLQAWWTFRHGSAG
jgi:hypothetical protein